MKLTVKNFGPIREAKDIEIKPMTVFVGPCNTGKSYLAMLIYATAMTFDSAPSVWKKLHREADEIVKQVREKNTSQLISTDLIERSFDIWTHAISDDWKKNVKFCFGNKWEELMEHSGFYVALFDESGSKLELNLSEPGKSKISQDSILRASELMIISIVGLNARFLSKRLIRWRLNRLTHSAFTTSILTTDNVYSAAYYLPASRGGIMQSHRTLVRALIRSASMAGIREDGSLPLLNGVLSSFLEGLISIDDEEVYGYRRHFQTNSKTDCDSDIFNVSKEIEDKILRGTIEIKKSETGYPDFLYTAKHDDKTIRLSLMNTSSSISELAPVVLYIRHYLDKNNLFILEEPEAHLHPAAQRQIAEILAKLVNAGVNVLITTHSDIVLDQIANFVYADNANSDTVTRLSKDKCLAYSFIQENNKTVVKKIPFDMDSGFITDDHSDTLSDLYNQFVSLRQEGENGNSN